MIYLRKKLISEIENVLLSNGVKDNPKVEVLPTKSLDYGVWYTPVAMKYCKRLGFSPVDLAKVIVSHLNDVMGQYFEKIEVRPPGFVNFFLSSEFYKDFLGLLLNEDCSLPGQGFIPEDSRKKILLEFVSANPTGPLSIAHARQAVIGDSLARILKFAGHYVDKEYYLNDVGVQIDLLGLSLKERCKEILGGSCVIPEGGYRGEYLKELAGKFLSIWRDKIEDLDKLPLEEFSKFAAGEILAMIRAELKRFGVCFDNWYSQELMEKSGKLEEVISILREKGLIYEKDGALWFVSSRFGDDKDRVIIKSNGDKTYFSADIAYHRDKFLRGYDLLIDMWGPDHHGYIPRIKAVIEALGYDPARLKVIIVQLVTIYKNGQPIPMSTRHGKYITIDELMDEVGVDSARFFLLMRKTDSHLDFDLDLAKKQAPENPVYYVQYAYARSCRIIEMAKTREFSTDLFKNYFYLPEFGVEYQLINCLLNFDSAIETVIFDFDPYALVDYLRNLASIFHKFYEKCRVLDQDEKIFIFRLGLVLATKRIIQAGLSLLGVSCPERM